MPGGFELIGFLLMALITVMVPVWLYRRFLRKRELEKELERSNRERDELKNEII
jgi:membrane protein implicated in regulation of membrane protease activity